MQKTTHENEKILIPGDPERETAQYRTKNGIPLLPKIIDDLKKLSEELEITFE